MERVEEQEMELKKLYGEILFFLRQKLFVIVLAITAVCSYGFAITHESIGVDDTLVGLYLEDGQEVIMGRWTIFLVNKLFHISEFTPFITELAGMLLLLTAVVLFCVLVRRIFGDRIGIAGYTAFAAVFVSFPFISEVWVYYYHDGVDIGYILTALSLLAFQEGLDQTGRQGLKNLAASMLFIWAAVGCYESFIIFYLLGAVMILFFRGITGKDRLTFGWLFRKLFLCGCAAAGCIILRTLIRRIIIIVFSLPEADSRNIWYGLQIFQSERWLQDVFMLLKKYWLVYFVNGAVYFPITVYVISVLVFGSAAVFYTVKKKNGWYFLLFVGMILIPALLTFVEQKAPLYRTCQYMPFFAASAVLLLYCLFVQKKVNGGGSLVFVILTACLVWNQACESNYIFYTDYRKYEYDKAVLSQIAWNIAEDYGRDVKVVFTGSYYPPYDLIQRYYVDFSSGEFERIALLTDWLDPLLKEKFYGPYGYFFGGEAEYSVISWGLYAFDKPGLEIARFLRMHGYDVEAVTDPELIREAQRYAEDMPAWPAEGSMAAWNGCVIVNF